MFLKNTWYVVCQSEELAINPMARKICSEDIVFYRQADGTPSALEDFCPHRGAPLSLGRVQGDRLICGYHGLEMGCKGKTLGMPAQRTHGFPVIKTYAVADRHGFIWVWPGEKAQANPSMIPDLHWAYDPEWTYGCGYYHVRADYRLMIDNLMDLTHEAYVHATSIGQKEIDETPCKTEINGLHVTTSRFINDIEAPPFFKMALRRHGLPDNQPVDRWQVCHYTPPSHVMLDVGVALSGHGGQFAPPEKKVDAIIIGFITPETEFSHHYLWGFARRFQTHDEELTNTIREQQRKVLGEDVVVLERQQENLSAQQGRRLLMLNIDAGGIQSRRVIERLLSERSESNASDTVAN